MSAIGHYGEIDADAIHEMLRRPLPQATRPARLQAVIDREAVRWRVERDFAKAFFEARQPVDPETGMVTYQQMSPAATSESAPKQMVPLLAVGAETEAPGAGIPPPRPVPPDQHFSYVQRLLGWPKVPEPFVEYP